MTDGKRPRSVRVVLAVAAVGAALAGALGALALWPAPKPRDPSALYEAHALPKTQARTVYWVGHSLMGFRDPHAAQKRNVIETVGALAEARAHAYASYEQIGAGSPLSLAYRGATHGYVRTDDALAARRQELLERGERYDALVLTDTVPIASAMKYEHSAYYATRFACDLLAKRADARVYLYESWVPLDATEDAPEYGSPAAWRFADRLAVERAGYLALADAVTTGAVLEPGWQGRLLRWVRPAVPCALATPVFVIPVGRALAKLHDVLARETWPHAGRALAVRDFFVNPLLAVPADWPRDDVDAQTARAQMTALPRRYPDEPIDDIHPSALGVYLAALVHYAVLYRDTPHGLPALDSGLEAPTLAKLQTLVWDVVAADPRTGVRAPQAAADR